MLDNLKKYKIMLASKSPRRHELLKMLDIPFNIAPTIEIDEIYPDNLAPCEVPIYLASLKANAYKSIITSNELVITADTVVINNDKVLGKPNNEEEACRMLLSMSGHSHTVITGVSLTTSNRQINFDVSTHVVFADISREDAEYYVSKYKPLDKAGAYGIQEWIGAIAVKAINGSFYNVMGLPVHQLYCRLKDF